ncbi:MAG: class I SAM-dependent methyltransferase [Saccharofermentans sp.]|nr:class I SAM-dependent methyltransferase [Saccharofermentans sp.]
MKNNIFQRVYNKIHSTILNQMDEASDKKICGQSLVKYVKSVYRDDANGVGMTGSQSTHYIILKRIFSHVTLTEQDNFIDIGCGKGRVLAYLIKEHAPCSLNGIEINEISYNVAQDWTKKYDQVNVMLGDAFKLDYNPYTVLFMGRPFLPVTFMQFIEAFEAGLDHPITLIYWVDQQSGYMLKNRPGWKMLYREKLTYIKGLRVARTPQGYSIWTYDPSLR